MSIEAVTAGGARDWVIVAQVKSYRVVYFTDDPNYEPPMQGDWYYVSPYRGELPKGMTLRNCWRWRFNGMEFVDAAPARAADPATSLLRSNQQALLDLLAQRVNAIRKPYEPSSTAGAELRAQKLAEAQAWLASSAADVPLLVECAAAHACSVGDMARRIVGLDAERRRVLRETEREREAIAAAVRRATTQQELAALRRRILDEVAADRVEPAPVKPEHTTPAKMAAALDAEELASEQLRLRVQLRNRINDLRRGYVSQYLLDDQVLAAKAEIAALVHKAGGALPPGVDGTALISHAAARGQRLAEAARDVLEEFAETREALLATEQMKDAVMARIAAVASRSDIGVVERTIEQLGLAPARQLPAKAAA